MRTVLQALAGAVVGGLGAVAVMKLVPWRDLDLAPCCLPRAIRVRAAAIRELAACEVPRAIDRGGARLAGDLIARGRQSLEPST